MTRLRRMLFPLLIAVVNAAMIPWVEAKYVACVSAFVAGAGATVAYVGWLTGRGEDR